MLSFWAPESAPASRLAPHGCARSRHSASAPRATPRCPRVPGALPLVNRRARVQAEAGRRCREGADKLRRRRMAPAPDRPRE
eukprot:2349591-Prymnesium_polylepis.1